MFIRVICCIFFCILFEFLPCIVGILVHPKHPQSSEYQEKLRFHHGCETAQQQPLQQCDFRMVFFEEMYNLWTDCKSVKLVWKLKMIQRAGAVQSTTTGTIHTCGFATGQSLEKKTENTM